MSRRSARATRDDLLYEAVSEGRRYPGMEHWLPLFHDRLDTLFDYVPGAPVVLEHLAEDAARERLAQIADYYEARKERADGRQRAARPTSRCRRTGSISPEAEWPQRLEHGCARAADAVRGAGQARHVVDAGAQAGPQLRAGARRQRRPTCSTP